MSCLRYESRLQDGLGAAQIEDVGPEGEAVLPAMDDATHVVLDHEEGLERDAPIELPRVPAHSRILRYGASSASTAKGNADAVPVTGSDDVTAHRRHLCAKVGLQRSTEGSGHVGDAKL